jgi:hypothetical protein
MPTAMVSNPYPTPPASFGPILLPSHRAKMQTILSPGCDKGFTQDNVIATLQVLDYLIRST